jgi:hypothetical protein
LTLALRDLVFNFVNSTMFKVSHEKSIIF